MLREYFVPAQHRPVLNPAFSLSPLELDEDIAILQPWYQLDYASYWNMQGLSQAQTCAFYIEQRQHGLTAYMGFFQDSPAFVMECYDPRQDPLSLHYAVQAGDIGMHFFVGPCHTPVPYFTRDILRSVMAFLFDELGAQRVVVEPDIRNAKVHRLNSLVGFVDAGTILLPTKTARLAFCSPENFADTLNTSDTLLPVALTLAAGRGII
ncbi:GNAT family N-acetyltransferase [Alcaligenes parafaecalis]|uniref:GNAT family N-acetyltransferase n=1 Tax=Alcaligenes parafaecalis TaxID=171260 RepID=A0ABT3VJC6_9BURK|nr:GNAT family N-acetyltransferase [Alcaligenes parafaecalis]MCX5462599.1 GNAT family N-acetyltransferase [Alcaligenes parafaecalis]